MSMSKTDKYIEEAIDSALNQTYQNFEIILYDNASEKKVFDVAQKYKIDCCACRKTAS